MELPKWHVSPLLFRAAHPCIGTDKVLGAAGYAHSAFTFCKEGLLKDVLASRRDFAPGSLIEIVQKGIQYKELQAQNAASASDGTASEYRVYTAQQLLHAADPAALASSVASDATAAAGPPEATASGGTTADQCSLIPLLGHSADVLAVAWQPRARQIATASADATARVWRWPEGRDAQAAACFDASAYAPADVLQHNAPLAADGPSAVHSLALTPDGKWLASASYDGIARVWGRGGACYMPCKQHSHTCRASRMSKTSTCYWQTCASSVVQVLVDFLASQVRSRSRCVCRVPVSSAATQRERRRRGPAAPHLPRVLAMRHAPRRRQHVRLHATMGLVARRAAQSVAQPRWCGAECCVAHA